MHRTVMRPACLAASALWLFAAPVVAGDIYVYQDSDGSRLITDHPRVESGYRLVKVYSESDVWSQTGNRSGGRRAGMRAKPSAFDDLIRETARQVDLDPMLIKSVMHAESAFDPHAVSRKGASGLMQLMPATARRYGVSSVFDPGQNVLGGARYLRYLLDHFNGDLQLALAGYNAGENIVEEVGGIPPYDETRRYVTKVIRLYREYRTENCEQHVSDNANFNGRIISCSASVRTPSFGTFSTGAGRPSATAEAPGVSVRDVSSSDSSDGALLNADEGQWRHIE